MKLVVVKNEQQTNIYQTEKSITNMDVCQWIVKKKKKTFPQNELCPFNKIACKLKCPNTIATKIKKVYARKLKWTIEHKIQNTQIARVTSKTIHPKI